VLLCASVLLNILLVGLSVMLAFKPADVVFVDKLGNTTFFANAATPEAPKDYEAQAFAQSWTRDFLSLDGITAKEDLARALSLTHPELQRKLKAALIDSGAVDKIRMAYVHSALKFEAVNVTRKAKDAVLVSLAGQRTLTAMGAEAKSLSEPFNLEIVLQPIDRTAHTPNGLMVRYLSGTFANNTLGASK